MVTLSKMIDGNIFVISSLKWEVIVFCPVNTIYLYDIINDAVMIQ